jgi:hypothetical protein
MSVPSSFGLIRPRVPDNEALNLSRRFAPRRLTPARYAPHVPPDTNHGG